LAFIASVGSGNYESFDDEYNDLETAYDELSRV